MLTLSKILRGWCGGGVVYVCVYKGKIPNFTVFVTVIFKFTLSAAVNFFFQAYLCLRTGVTTLQVKMSPPPSFSPNVVCTLTCPS